MNQFVRLSVRSHWKCSSYDDLDMDRHSKMSFPMLIFRDALSMKQFVRLSLRSPLGMLQLC